MKSWNRSAKLALVVGVAMLSALAFAACGSDDKKSGSDETAKSSDVNKYENELATLYEGNFELPTGPTVEPEKGKDIWLITAGQSVETSQNLTAAIEAASAKLGWSFSLFDGKFESTRYLTGVQQALAAKADGIILFSIDCAPIKSALEQADAAGVSVVSIEGKDCDPSLFDYTVTYGGGLDFQKWIEDGWAGSQAKWVVAETKGQAKTIVTVETDIFVTRIALPGIERVFDKCPTCEIVDVVNFVGTDFGPPLQQKIEQSLTEHPEANSFIAAYDAVMTSGGGAAALRASGRLGEMSIMGGEGSAPGVELIRDQAGVDACSGIDYSWQGYAALNGMALLFGGEDPSEADSGIGSQVCDLEHNLPPEGEPYQAPLDYISAYEELWSLK